VGGLALTIGNRIYQAATKDSVKTTEAFAAALPYRMFADSTLTDASAKTNAKLVIGITNFYMASTIIGGLEGSKSCEDTKRTQNFATEAQIYVGQGGRANPEGAKQVMDNLMQWLPYLESATKRFCK
jgi:hypothetical protein